MQLNLMVLTPTACDGSDLKLRLEVTNTTKEAIKLDRAYFWNNYSVSSSSEQSKDSGFWEEYWPGSTSEDIVTLAPGETYVSHSYWSLTGRKDEPLEPGNYTLEIFSYGDSAKAKFVIQNCKSERVESRKG